MPNYCSNTLSFSHITEDQWLEISATFRGNETKECSFLSTFYPEPNWNLTPNQNGELPRPHDVHGFSCWADGKQDDRSYYWRYDHWGTNWDVFDCRTEFAEETPGTELVVDFYSANSPFCEECMQQISRHFPGTMLINRYNEEDGDYCGVTVAKDGSSLEYYSELIPIREQFVRKLNPCLPFNADFSQVYEEQELWDGFKDFLREGLVTTAKNLVRQISA